MRLKIIRIIILILFVFILVGLFYLQIINGSYYYQLSKNNRIRVVPLEGWRGRIKDCNGKVLADNQIAYNIMIIPQELNDLQNVFAFLSKTLEVEKEALIKKYRNKKLTPFAPVIIAENVSREKAIVVEENKHRLPGVLIDKNFIRSYPLKKNSSHVVGYVGKMNRAKIDRFKEYGYSTQSLIGYSGVEEYYDSYLKGEQGGLQIEINSRGKQVRLLSLKEPSKGQDIALTIDSDLQGYLNEILDGSVGSAIVMDMTNGEILGMTNYPSYDPNIFTQRRYQHRMARVLAGTLSPLLNRAIKGAFPPGSVFKIPVAIAGLDTKKNSSGTIFECEGFLELAGIRFGCTHVHGSQNLIEALAHSCNIYFYRLGQTLGADIMYKYAKMLGLGEPTHIDLPYEEKGFIPRKRYGSPHGKKRWYTGDSLNFAIGQGNVLTTPLQLVSMMATVAMEGTRVHPHVIKSIGDRDLSEEFLQRKVKIDERTFQEVKKGLRAAVFDYSGTANILDIQGVYVAGKTGTAQTSGDQDTHSWFVGYTKSKKGSFAFCVFLEHGGSSQNANMVARQLLLHMQKEEMI